MDQQESQSILTEHLRAYRGRSYADLVAMVGQDEHIEITGPSGQWYQLEVNVLWDASPGGDVRVIASIDDGGLRALSPLSDGFIKGRDDTFIGES